ncbi:hypothetical protein BDN67DRAFT_963580 [Paxillus ammoniavirescens]|nr:hypothetical protein BDN67DRAFT_963580 [Paxillus ammoniavirescens]
MPSTLVAVSVTAAGESAPSPGHMKSKRLVSGGCQTDEAHYLQKQQPLAAVWCGGIGKHVAKQRRRRIWRCFPRPHVLQRRAQYDVLHQIRS